MWVFPVTAILPVVGLGMVVIQWHQLFGVRLQSTRTPVRNKVPCSPFHDTENVTGVYIPGLLTCPKQDHLPVLATQSPNRCPDTNNFEGLRPANYTT